MTHESKVSRTDLRYIVDTLMFLCILGVVVIGLLQAFVIPEGPTAAASSKYFLGLHRHQWGDIHLYLSLAFTGLLVIHLILEWKWIRGKAARIFGRGWKAALTLTVLAAALVPALFWIVTTKNDPAYAEYGAGAGRRGGRIMEIERPALPAEQPPPAKAPEETATAVKAEPESAPASAAAEHEDKTVAGRLAVEPVEYVITGQTTLGDIERDTGIPARDIAVKLGLPATISSSETLGRLRRRFGFAMEDVREIVASALKEKKK
jgi:hypothetical protein